MNVLTQVRIPKQQLDFVDKLVKKGEYANRSEAIRAAIRQMAQREKGIKDLLQVGIIPNTGDSVKEVRAFREKFDKQRPSAQDINSILRHMHRNK
jgi:antitoxin ParD1/3/4